MKTLVSLFLIFFLSLPTTTFADEVGEEALSDEAPAALDCPVCHEAAPADKLSEVELFTATGQSVIGIVLIVELLRYLIKPLRRRRGFKLTEPKRAILVVLPLLFGQALAFSEVAPALRPGNVAKVFLGLVITALAVLFNETVWSWVRKWIEKKFGEGVLDHGEVTPGTTDGKGAP
jgi:hypothetical protein